MTQSRSLALRAAMAVALMGGFYALALSIVVGLLWMAYADYTFTERVHLRVIGPMIASAGTILWALVPRPDRFTAPGPQLTRADAPKLFEAIDEVARVTAQEPPAEVYLVNAVNAWVTHRGGVMGVGSRRIMGVGLPLLTHLSPAEVKAVIAHEFGHYVSGDVSLGPWIYKTRAAIGRALGATEDTWLAKPFEAYSRLFLRTTMAVSREQEFEADRTAARVSGAAAMMTALHRVESLAPAYHAYVDREVVPVMQSGFLPPIAEGFGQYLTHPRTQAVTNAFAETATTGEDTGEFDTHPPLAERLAALAKLPPAPPASPDQGGPMLERPDRQAEVLMRHLFGDEAVGTLRPVGRSKVGELVYGPRWDDTARRFAEWFGTMTVGQLPSGAPAYMAMGARLVGSDEGEVSGEERFDRAVRVLTAGLGAALVRAGWTVYTAPGHSLELVRGDERLEPATVVARLADGTETTEAWRATTVRLGVEGVALKPEESLARAAGM